MLLHCLRDTQQSLDHFSLLQLENLIMSTKWLNTKAAAYPTIHRPAPHSSRSLSGQGITIGRVRSVEASDSMMYLEPPCFCSEHCSWRRVFCGGCFCLLLTTTTTEAALCQSLQFSEEGRKCSGDRLTCSTD